MPLLSVPGYGSVSYVEHIPGSPVLTFSHGGSRAERTFVVDYADVDAFVKGMLGFPRIVALAGIPRPNNFYVSRVLPQALPGFNERPGQVAPWLYATAVTRIQPQGALGTTDANDMALYQKALVTVHYESLTFRIKTDQEVDAGNQTLLGFTTPLFADESTLTRFVTTNTKPMAEFLQLPRGTKRWVDALTKQPIDFANAVLQPAAEITWTWHQVPFVPDAAVRPGRTPYIGSVNDRDITVTNNDGRSITYRAGTLLVLGAEVKPYRMGSAIFVNDITYRLKHFEPEPGRGHNFFLRVLQKTLLGLSISVNWRLKITSTGNNDALAIPANDPLVFANPAENGIHPYALEVPPSDGVPVYPYRDFRNLFRWQLP